MKTFTYENGCFTESDQPELTKANILRTRLTIAVTAYDYAIQLRSRRDARVYHNPFALSLYLDAIERVIEAVETMPLPDALRRNFTGHMLNSLLRKVAR